jgi:hypothetical protein
MADNNPSGERKVERLIVRRGDTQYSDEAHGVFGYATVEFDDSDELDVDIHFWPLDADHYLDLDCDCKPRIEMQWAAGMRLIIHRKTN